MSILKFPAGPAHFDGECVRFRAVTEQRDVTCGVTIYALKHRCSHLPLEGLLPAEMFLQAYSDGRDEIHKIANVVFLGDMYDIKFFLFLFSCFCFFFLLLFGTFGSLPVCQR